MSITATDSQIEIVVNGQPRRVVAGTVITELLQQLEIPLRGVAVETNGEIVPRSRHGEQILAAGDRLEIVSLVGGG